MRIHALPPEEVTSYLVTSDQGLSEESARRRLHEYGYNEIKEVRRKPLYQRFLAQFTHFLAVLLWIAAALSFVSEYLNPGEGMLSLGLAIVVVIVINAIFTFIQEYRAERAIHALEKLLPFNVKVLREGLVKELPAREIVPGDVILLGEGDKVPADARLIEAHRLMVNNAPLTGESALRLRGHEPFTGEYLDSPNIVFAGTLVASGSGRAVVFSTGMSTEFGKIAHLTSAVEPGLSPLQKEIIKAARVVATIAVTTGFVFFSVGVLSGRSFWHNFLFAVGIIIANVPEGLLPTVTLALAMGSQRMAKKKALIKTLTSVETLGSVTVICTDKTGTLTRNKMEVTRLWGPGTGTIEYRRSDSGGTPPLREVAMLMKIAYLCNNAVYEEGKYRGDPTETALLKAARESYGDVRAVRIAEIPFDSERKRMTTIHAIEGDRLALTKGALETVLPRCSGMLYQEGERALDDEGRAALLHAYHAMMDSGLRVIAFAYKRENIPADEAAASEMLVETDMIFAGLIGLEDPPRPEVPGAIQKCRSAGVRVIMITGDASRTALAIARQIGLVSDEESRSHKERGVVIEGPALDAMTDRAVRERLLSGEVIFSRMTPGHKMRIVALLKDEGERVAVTGDGVNDAPALKKADIGIAMGVTGTDVAREAADIILLDDNFATIVNAIEEGRGVFENIRKFISYIFASNIPEIVPYIAYVLFSIPLPLTIMQILAIDLGTDMFPALALGAEQPSKEVMSQPPRRREERLLNFSVLGRAYLFLGPIEAFAGLYGFFFVLNAGGWQWGEMLPAHDLLYLKATTACLGAIIITQIGNVFACRSFRESVFSIGFFSNRLILLGIALEIAISIFIIYTPPGNAIFGTTPLDPSIWLVLFPFSILLLAVEEIRKLYVRRMGRTVNR